MLNSRSVSSNENKQINFANLNEIEQDGFNIEQVLRLLKHYLPSQTPLKDFIHHNTLHAFQNLKFYEGIFKASGLFGYQVTLELADYRKLYKNGRIRDIVLERIIQKRKGEKSLEEWKSNLFYKAYNESNTALIGLLRSNWKSKVKLDLDSLVQPLLFRIICSYLDQGIAYSKFPLQEHGFLESIRHMELNSFTSLFRTKRAKRLLQDKKISIPDLLKIIVGNELYYEGYLFDQQFSHQGWSGLVSTIEDEPDTLFDARSVSLNDFILLELLMEIDVLDFHFGEQWNPLCSNINIKPFSLMESLPLTELNEVLIIWQDAFEWSYYDEVLSAISLSNGHKSSAEINRSFQSMFCIDERECSIRRYLEKFDPNCETFGTPGFFGVEFYFQAENAKFYQKLCPAPVMPAFLIKESNVNRKKEHEMLYNKRNNNIVIGFLSSIPLGFWAFIRLLNMLFRPTMSPAISNAFSHMDANSKLTIENKSLRDMENGLQIGFTIEEMTDRVEGLLKSIGLTKDFAGIVYVIAHGSSSANNPHHSAHDCGACSGKPGSVNAKVFAGMVNLSSVREKLSERGIDIPESTQFIGALHDTSADEIEYYDLHILNLENERSHKINTTVFEKALDSNAKERSRRFKSINTKDEIKKVRRAIKNRSVSLFEPRPELGHGTNALCIVGRRALTKNLFLDRRAFLNSYDYNMDPKGILLAGIMKPLGPVCGGINLEYYFSKVDNQKLGAGTKLPHNIMGLIGVANSVDGDLRPGLPLQMIEVHDPVRLLIIVEHFPQVVLQTIQSVPDMYDWYKNEWIHLVSMNPETNDFYYFKDGSFTLCEILSGELKTTNDLTKVIENAAKMETNYIVDATEENLPVYSIQS